jgi:DNA-binding winged helix-turn-helix (wHTH) protein
MVRYRFGDHRLSPRRRLLVRQGIEQPLIPRYFDLLVFLIEHRHEAVHRRDIFDRVWRDVVVSDSALTQAIRTIRRVLGDDIREPKFIRTVSRHGYRFVFEAVVEEADDDAWPTEAWAAEPPRQPFLETPVSILAKTTSEVVPDFEPLLERLTDETRDDEDRHEAAELLHQLGTGEALVRLDRRPGHARARAILRDARWDVPGAGPVPIAGSPDPLRTSASLIALRIQRAARIAAGRGVAAAVGGGVAGVVAGVVGGLLLAVLPGGTAPPALAAVLAMIGGAAGTLGGAAVGAGISYAEAVARSRRFAALIAGAALGGGLAGGLAQWLGHWTLTALFGVNVPLGGFVEGVTIGAAAGLGFAIATRDAHDGLAAPRGWRRAAALAWVAGACGAAALVLALAGRPLVGGTIHEIARSANGSRAALTSLGRLVGEPDFGPISRAVLSIGEAATFGLGLAAGLTRRRRA